MLQVAKGHAPSNREIIPETSNCTNQSVVGLDTCCQCVRVQISALPSLWHQIFVLAAVFAMVYPSITTRDKFELTVQAQCAECSPAQTAPPLWWLITVHGG